MTASGQWDGSARRLLAAAAVVALLVASVLAAIVVYGNEREDAERANEARARQAASIAERVVELSGASLSGGEGVLRQAGPMPEGGFRRYARDVLAGTSFRALGWHPRVPARERRSFESALGRPIGVLRPPTKRHPAGDMRPVPPRRGAYLPLRLVHPDERPQRALLGFDALSEPARSAAVRAARESGRPMASAPVVAGRATDPVVAIFDPVYEPGAPVRTPEQRRLALRGTLSGGIRAQTIRNEMQEQLGAGLDLAVDDAGAPLVASSSPPQEGEAATANVLGRDWEVWVQDVDRASIVPPLAVGGVGLALAALVASLFALTGRRELILSRERDIAAAEADAQRQTARTLQRALLPPSLPVIPSLETAVAYRPAAGGLEVGGDFYDLFDTDSQWTAVIGDVSGKGAGAAALTALVRHTVRAFADMGPAETVRRVNLAVWHEGRPSTFATLCVAALRPADGAVEVALANAGHPPPLVLRRGGPAEPIEPTAPLVGAIERIRPAAVELRLVPGDTMLFYTDGLIEARSPDGGVFGEARLRRVVEESGDGPAEALVSEVLERAAAFAPGFPQDDVAILALRARAV
jgi:serine phosphatase RsbU (regulator of sigma subunit)/CHASE1-domain containing sensor protein